MYRQVLIEPQQRKFQKLVWRDNQDEKPNFFELNTVTYGTATAPYLATRCIHQLGLDNKENYPEPSRMITNDMYVDDLLTGSNTITELQTNLETVSDILEGGSFNLRKWRFNFTPSNSNFDIDNINSCFEFSDNTKTLGILYNNDRDTFQFEQGLVRDNRKIKNNKTIVSVTAQLFDPFGLLCPITIIPKLIIQQLWKEQLGWDDSIPSQIASNWKEYVTNIETIKNIVIPRHVIAMPPKHIEMHGFADASVSAYGACMFIRTLNENNEYHVHLLTAKSRVTPLKMITIPRLELCAAHLLSKLAHKVMTILNIELEQVYLWPDSIITVSWIRGSPSTWKTFVANRVSEIHDLSSNNNWY